MIGCLLDDDIAGPHVHHRVVEHHVDLAGQHDGVIDGTGAVHQRMSHGKTPRRRALADHLHHEVGIHFRFFGRIERRKFDHEQRGAEVGRQRRRFGAAIVRERESRRRGVRNPQLGRWGASGLERDAAVEQRNRLVVGIEGGHDAADVGCRCGGARQDERDDRGDYLAGHCVLLFMPAKPIPAR
jgi:hypothetical protein